MQINMKFMSDMQETAIDDNVIVIEVTGTNGIDKGSNRDLHLLSRMVIPGHPTEFVAIKPKKITDPQSGKGDVCYWYVVYDLCLVTPDSEI